MLCSQSLGCVWGWWIGLLVSLGRCQFQKVLPSEAQEDKGALEAAGQFALSTQESGLWPPGGMGYPPGLMGQLVLATSPELSHVV